jgi:hypothetical protein
MAKKLKTPPTLRGPNFAFLTQFGVCKLLLLVKLVPYENYLKAKTMIIER